MVFLLFVFCCSTAIKPTMKDAYAKYHYTAFASGVKLTATSQLLRNRLTTWMLLVNLEIEKTVPKMAARMCLLISVISCLIAGMGCCQKQQQQMKHQHQPQQHTTATATTTETTATIATTTIINNNRNGGK